MLFCCFRSSHEEHELECPELVLLALDLIINHHERYLESREEARQDAEAKSQHMKLTDKCVKESSSSSEQSHMKGRPSETDHQASNAEIFHDDHSDPSSSENRSEYKYHMLCTEQLFANSDDPSEAVEQLREDQPVDENSPVAEDQVINISCPKAEDQSLSEHSPQADVFIAEGEQHVEHFSEINTEDVSMAEDQSAAEDQYSADIESFEHDNPTLKKRGRLVNEENGGKKRKSLTQTCSVAESNSSASSVYHTLHSDDDTTTSAEEQPSDWEDNMSKGDGKSV